MCCAGSAIPSTHSLQLSTMWERLLMVITPRGVLMIQSGISLMILDKSEIE